MSRRANCWDNVAMGRFFRSYKSKWMPQECYSGYFDAGHDIAAYMRHYNYRREHSHNGYLAPALAQVI
jgi:putative transposase